MIRVSRRVVEAIGLHGVREFPHECCGVLLGDMEGETRVVREARPLANVHEDGHERRYLIAPEQMLGLLRAERAGGPRILGFYHSHPDEEARPSAYDLDWAAPWYTYVIVSVLGGRPSELTAWRVEDEGAAFQPDALEFVDS